ncbi:MAG: hydroxyethylthiazole kinase [Verrucomicrobia bacterium]|nr:hydroxyethylthiazole kinase [Verrucomicrobiota bacterium]
MNQVYEDLQRVRAAAPLVHNITNYVVMSSTANALLAIGASPVMAHACQEVEEMVALAQALVINMGTLSTPWVEAMVKAGKEARRRGIPVVFDPVGCGATRFRTATARNLTEEIHPTIIRGNASEIRALFHAGKGTKGVDSIISSEAVIEDAQALSVACGCVVSVSGEVDLVVEGRRVTRVANGHPLMARVTGMGCTATAITGAFAAVNPSTFHAASHAMVVAGIAGEIAAERATGPGSFPAHFLDALYLLQESDIASRSKMHTPTSATPSAPGRYRP